FHVPWPTLKSSRRRPTLASSLFCVKICSFKMLKIRVARLTMNHSGGLREISSRVQSPSSPGRWECSEMCPYDRHSATQYMHGATLHRGNIKDGSLKVHRYRLIFIPYVFPPPLSLSFSQFPSLRIVF
uniref:Uncharacterized protein n=1 Tax=Gadus morhua TaxID=8049 RepID=A0A8C5C8G5_GADMO